MVSKIPQKYVDLLTIRDLEDLIELKRRNGAVSDLMRERDRLRLELKRIEDTIERLERSEIRITEEKERTPLGLDLSAGGGPAASFLAGKRKKNLKDYIAQVLMEAGEPLSPAEIQGRLREVGYVSESTNPRSFYNTVFQALQRYEIFQKENKKYRLPARRHRLPRRSAGDRDPAQEEDPAQRLHHPGPRRGGWTAQGLRDREPRRHRRLPDRSRHG
jgi:hypothetical protein